jgi:hypothetical protein
MFGTPEVTSFRPGGCRNSADSFVIEDGWIVAQTIHYAAEKRWLSRMGEETPMGRHPVHEARSKPSRSSTSFKYLLPSSIDQRVRATYSLIP